MAKPEAFRILAVIKHADVARSAALSLCDETLTHQRINDTLQPFPSFIQTCSGAVREHRADSLVAEFVRSSDSVCGALKFQQLNKINEVRVDRSEIFLL